MAVNDYHFITIWRVTGNIVDVARLLNDPLSLARWWPSVYLDVWEIEPGDDQGVGRVIGLYTKGWLPYTLRWQFRVTESHFPYGFTLEASGDFVGRGIWTLEQSGDEVTVTYDWNIAAEKPLLRDYSMVMKPVFQMNHAWAMARGKESLDLEMARLAASTPEERALVPVPPGPTSAAPAISATVGALVVLAGVLGLRLLESRRK